MASKAAAHGATPIAPAGPRTRWRHAHRRWRHSLRWRLLTVFLLLALATTGAFVFGTQRALVAGWQGWVKPIVADHLDRLVDEIGSPPSAERAAAITRRLPITIRIDGPQVQFDSHAEREHDERRRAWRASQGHGDREDWGSIERRTADGHRIRFGLAPPPHEDRPRVLGWLTLAALLLFTAVAYGAVRRLLRPLDAIGAGALRFGAGRFNEPIPVRRRDELGELAERVNDMARSLHGMLEAKRGLLLAISHELRSPLTRARLNAELVPEGAQRDALLRDLAEMRDLITDLLESERLSDGHRALHTEPTDLPALIAEALAEHSQAHPQDPPPTFAVQATSTGDTAPITVAVDRARLRLLLRNLLANAARHGRNEQDGKLNIQVELTQAPGGMLSLSVRDHGPGVPPEQLSQLAQAFYRPDAARTRDAGGVGLGLYLCRLVAQAHGGELQISNAGPGLRVGMRWAGVALTATNQ